MATQKAGCYLIDTKSKMVALIFREKQNDFTFPKGHLEQNETLEECAIRETAEETKRIAKIVKNISPIVETYTTPKGENCECHMFVAIDEGPSNNSSTDTHSIVWTSIDEVVGKLSYDSLKQSWQKILPEILKIL